MMNGTYDENGEYSIEVRDNLVGSDFSKQTVVRVEEEDGTFTEKIVSSHLEPKIFMVINSLHHPGLAAVQFKTFFHMCKLESIFFDHLKRDGSMFTLYDTL